MMVSKRHLLYQGLIFRFSVKLLSFRGCNAHQPSRALDTHSRDCRHSRWYELIPNIKELLDAGTHGESHGEMAF